MVSVDMNMPYTEEEAIMSNSELTVPGYIQGEEPLEEEEAGALLRFVPDYDGTIQVAGQLEEGQHFQISQVMEVSAVTGSAAKVVFDYENIDKKSDILFDEFEVKADETYYIGADKGNMRFYQFNYTYKGYVDAGVNLIAENEKRINLIEVLNESAVSKSVPIGTYMNGQIKLEKALPLEVRNDKPFYDATTKNEINDKVTGHRSKIGGKKTDTIQFTPKYNGTIQIAGQIDASKAPNKRVLKVYEEDSTGEKVIYSYEHTTDAKNFVFEEIKVEVGKTYYMAEYDVASDGTESGKTAYIYEIIYKYNKPIDKIPEYIIPAFPGAVGGGKYVSGGRGKPVYTVTNLTDDVNNPQEGSFRWAINQTEKRSDPDDENSVGGTIVFNVSGNIELAGTLS